MSFVPLHCNLVVGHACMSKRKGDDRDRKGNKKGKYVQSSHAVSLNGPGVMISCITGKERQAARDTITLFEEHADRIYGPVATAQGSNEVEHASVAAALKAEIEELNAADKSHKKRFWHLPTSAKGLVYVRFLDEAVIPSVLVKAIVQQVIYSFDLWFIHPHCDGSRSRSNNRLGLDFVFGSCPWIEWPRQA